MIDFNKNKNGIYTISLNRNPVNAINISFIKELHKVIQDIYKSKGKVLLIKSSQKHFCAGADLQERIKLSDKDILIFLDSLNNVLSLIENLSIPTIASVNGACLGGGLELALSCDFRLASNNAVLGFPETSIGIIPGAGGTQRLTRLVGVATSMRWIFTADKYTAIEAAEDGVVDRVYDYKDYDMKVIEFASLILKNSPSALKSAKSAIKSAFINEGFVSERAEYLKILNTHDRSEGLKSFKEKRNPRWSNK